MRRRATPVSYVFARLSTISCVWFRLPPSCKFHTVNSMMLVSRICSRVKGGFMFESTFHTSLFSCKKQFQCSSPNYTCRWRIRICLRHFPHLTANWCIHVMIGRFHLTHAVPCVQGTGDGISGARVIIIQRLLASFVSLYRKELDQKDY